MPKRKKCITIDDNVANQLEAIAMREKVSFSQLIEEGAINLIERREELQPENLQSVIEEIVEAALKRQQDVPSEMRKYM